MRLTKVAAVLMMALAVASTLLPTALALPPLENNVTFPAGSFVIPMDDLQAERILVFGFVHALLLAPDPIQIFRVIEPPNATFSTNMTASPRFLTGGPFLVLPSDASKVSEVENRPEFQHVTVGMLTSPHTLNNIFRVTQPTKILVVKGEPAWGRTDMTLDAMRIPYNLTTHASLAANPNMIFSYTLIVIDCNGWNGFIPSSIASSIQSHVNAGNEVIFTDRALWDLNSTFPGYVTLTGAQPTDRTSNAYAYNPPRKYDPTKYGSTADRFTPEFPTQYYNPPPHANDIKVYTESMGIAVSAIQSGRVNDVRILSDSNNFGPTGNQYAILAFYFQYGDGIVEGLAFHPQQQGSSAVGNNGYYAVYQFYGNKFVHGPPPKDYSLNAAPTSASTPQGTSFSFTITVTSFGAFNSPVALSATGVPPSATYSFSPPAPQPPAGGIATSTLTVTVPLTTPIESYPINVTGTDTSIPPIIRWVPVTLNVTMAPADFSLEPISPTSLTINTTESKNAIVTVVSIGLFNQNVTLNATGLPAHVTATFTPLAPKPPAGATASSIMKINVGAEALNGTYLLTISGSNGTATRYAPPFTLIIVKKPSPGIPLVTLLLILGLAMVGMVLGLVASASSSRKRKPPAPALVGPVVAAPPKPQRMYVVPMAAQRVRCPHCGRPVALEAVYCPYCGQRRSVRVAGVVGSGSIAGARSTGRRAVWGFVLAMVSSVLILLNSAALLSPSFWGAPTNWSGIFWWLGAPSGFGQWFAVLVGVIAGFIVMTGGMAMIMKRGVMGALITLPFAMLSIIIGGGFLAGAALGIAAGILGAVGR